MNPDRLYCTSETHQGKSNQGQAIYTFILFKFIPKRSEEKLLLQRKKIKIRKSILYI